MWQIPSTKLIQEKRYTQSALWLFNFLYQHKPQQTKICFLRVVDKKNDKILFDKVGFIIVGVNFCCAIVVELIF